MDREVVKKLIQDQLNSESITSELRKVLDDNSFRNKMLTDFTELQTLLGGPGASQRAAEIIVKDLNQ